MESVTFKGCKVHYDPKNISKETALEQANRRIEEARKRGSQLKSFTAFVAHKGEEWYDQLRRFKSRLREAKNGTVHA